jgi:hypothetical protein
MSTPEEIAASVPDFAPDFEEGADDNASMPEGNPTPEDADNAPKESTQSMLKKFKLKVDGEEIEEEFDLSNEEALIKELQLAKAAKKRMAEAQDAKRKAYELMQSIDQDPANMLKRLGPKGFEIAERLLLEKMQDEMLSPEEKNFRDMKRKLEAYEAQEKEMLAKQEQQKLESLEKEQAEHYQQVIIDALEKSGLPKTAESAKRLAFLLHKNLQLGIELDAVDLAKEVKNEYTTNIQQLLKNATPEQLVELLDKDAVKKLRQYDTNQFKARQKFSNTKTAAQGHALPPQTKGRGYQTLEEWQEELNQRLKK